MIYLRLFWEFFQIGLFSIGGGAATIPYLMKLTTTTNWFTSDQLTNFIAISESTPGAIGVNMATFAGFLAVNDNFFLNSLGGLVATIGLITPSIIIIIIISYCLQAFKENTTVGYVFYGLRPASTALIAGALFFILKDIDLVYPGNSFETFFNFKSLIVAFFLGCLIFKYKAHPLLYIVIAAIVGIILKL